MATKNTQLKGDLFLLNDSQQSFAAAQVELLTAIDDCGSISKAAKQIGISYKTAWDRIDAMNNMAEKALVTRSVGGMHGGGTRLTDTGKKIIEGFQILQAEHKAFVEHLGSRLHSLTDVANFMRRGTMKTSARNQFRGEVIEIKHGAVNSEVILQIGDAQTLVAIITNDSVQNLNLSVGHYAVALIKASWVLLSKETQLKISARNHLIGTIARISEGAVNSDITIDLGSGKSISSMITNTSVAELELQTGDTVCAFFKASSVILMVE